MPDDGEPLEPQRAHHLDLIHGHRALGVLDVVVAARRLSAVPIAPQVGADDREVLGEVRRDSVPHGMRLWVAVKQEHRRPRASAHDVYPDPIRVDPLASEARQHVAVIAESSDGA